MFLLDVQQAIKRRRWLRIVLLSVLTLLWLPPAWATGVMPIVSADSVSADSGSAPRLLAQVARRVSMQSAEIRAEFAHIALTEMFLACLAESLTAQEQVLDRRDANLQRWIGAVDRYAARLQAMAQRPGSDVRVLLWPGEHEQIVLLINGEPVMVSSVRWAEQVDLERHIVEQFCLRRHCSGTIASTGLQRSSGRAQRVVTPVWHLSGAGPSCQDGRGLALHFADMSQMQRKREVCQQIISELDTLALALAQQRSLGGSVDWHQVRVLSQPGARGYAVRVNAAGERLWLHLPALASTRGLFPQIAPWLAARASGIDAVVVIADADAIIAPLLQN